MSTQKLVVGNWKMNLGVEKSRELAAQVVSAGDGLSKTQAWIAPVFTSLAAVSEIVNNSEVKLGGQNVHWAQSGAFTGEIAPDMLRELGCSFAIVGHSERRHVFGETDQLIAKRAEGALQFGLVVIYCIGETLPVREAGQTNQLLSAQLEPIFKLAAETSSANLILAYEPVWAIGTGKVASIDEIREAHSFIRQHWSSTLKRPCPAILYGGSVTPDNFGEIVELGDVGGALVGGASLTADKFSALLKIAESRKQ